MKMAIFLSTFVNPIDNKGRVVVPKEFRIVLDKFQGFVAFRSHNFNAVDCFSMERMEKLSAQIDETMDPFSTARDSIESAVFADAVILRFDKDGRVVLPEILLSHANIMNKDKTASKEDNKIAFIGLGATFQLWDPAAFKMHQDQIRAKLLSEKTLNEKKR